MKEKFENITLEQLKDWNVPPVQQVEIENDWIVITFQGIRLGSGFRASGALQNFPMAPARIKFRNWQARSGRANHSYVR